MISDNTFESITKELQNTCIRYHNCEINHVTYMQSIDNIYDKYGVRKKDYIETLHKKIGKVSHKKETQNSKKK